MEININQFEFEKLAKIEDNLRLILSEEKNNLRNEGKHNSDSFERFGDHLCQSLLTFLPLKQKFRFESISQQWKSLLFNKVFVLDINGVNDQNNCEPNDENKDDIQFFDECSDQLIKDVFEIVVKKCVFVKHMKVMPNFLEFAENTFIFELIANNCLYLEAFEYCFAEYVKNVVKNYVHFNKLIEFMDKFGLKLKFLNIKCKPINNNFLKDILEKTPNVEKLYLNNFSVFIELKENILQNLKKVKFYEFKDIFIKKNIKFEFFVDKYHNKIEIINIEEHLSYNNNVLTQLSRFENLKVLYFCAHFRWDNIFIDETLELIAEKCLHLNELSLTLRSSHEIKTFRGKVFQCFSHFKALKTLSINLMIKQNRNFGELKNLSNIKNLSKLSLNSYKMREKDFKDIDLYLRQLKTINFSNLENITDKYFKYLSKMPNLSSLELYLIDPNITFDGFQQLIDNSLNLSSITIESNTNIFEDKTKTVNCLINWSKRRPKVMHEFKYIRELFIREFDFWQINENEFEIPSNLKIVLNFNY